MDLGLAGRVCAVTGASRGIGFAISRQLVAEGAAVLMIARGVEGLEQAAAACVEETVAERQAAGMAAGEVEATLRSKVATLALDVTDDDAGERLVGEAERRFGRLDSLVNNAGIARWHRPEEITDDDWRAQFEINVMAPMRAMRAAIPAMAERGWGRVVNVCSTSGKRPSAWMPDYSAAKAAELSLSRWFADRYAKDGVLINAISPGPTRSEMWTAAGGLADQAAELTGADSAEQAIERAGAGRPIGRFAEPEEIASTVVFLCSERASYVAGAAWAVDGGTVPVII